LGEHIAHSPIIGKFDRLLAKYSGIFRPVTDLSLIATWFHILFEPRKSKNLLDKYQKQEEKGT